LSYLYFNDIKFYPPPLDFLKKIYIMLLQRWMGGAIGSPRCLARFLASQVFLILK